MQLNRAHLPDLDARVAVPSYDPATLTPGIVHIGVGGFHRAHQAVYLDRLLNQGQAHDWAIIGLGLLPGDAAMRNALAPQDHLYTVTEKHPDGTLTPRVVGAMIDYLFAPRRSGSRPGPPRRPCRPPRVDHHRGRLPRRPGLGGTRGRRGARRGSRAGRHPGHRVRVPRRGARPPPHLRDAALHGDELRQHPGQRFKLARRMITAYARLRDPGLADWIEAEVAFPNSMVDRITPVTTDAHRTALRDRFGLDDNWPVVCEPFLQWVLEDHFPSGRPAWSHAGVQLVDEVLPYELMKLRLLNASHQALAYLGHLAGYTYAHEGRAGPPVRRLPARVHGTRGHPDPRARAGRRPGRLPAHPHRTVRQPRGARHARTARRVHLGPDPHFPPPGGAPRPRARWRVPACRPRRGGLGALRGGCRRAGSAHRRRRPAPRRGDDACGTEPRRARGVPRRPEPVRRSGRAAGLHGRAPPRPWPRCTPSAPAPPSNTGCDRLYP